MRLTGDGSGAGVGPAFIVGTAEIEALGVATGLSDWVADGVACGDGNAGSAVGVDDGAEEATIGVGELGVVVADGVGEALHETVAVTANKARTVRRITPILTMRRIVSLLSADRVAVGHWTQRQAGMPLIPSARASQPASRKDRRIQGVGATIAASIAAGVWYPSVLRGLVLSRVATASRSTWL